MILPQVKNSLNAIAFAKDYEKLSSISKTVPDQSMTIREIKDRYARGIPFLGGKQEIWHGEDNDMPDITHMDLADRQAYLEGYAEELKILNDKKSKYEKEQSRKKIFNAAKAEIARDAKANPAPAGTAREATL